VNAALSKYGIVNVSQLAEDIRHRNEIDNVALEDIQAQVIVHAQSLSAAMEFARPAE
jgi:hypothetical protein